MEGYGEFIRKHRISSGFKSQRRLADKSGISSATISRIESEIQKPELETLQVLSKYLETTSLVELMVACGYWSEDELLATDSLKHSNDIKSVQPHHVYIRERNSKVYESENKTNEEEFIENIDLTDKELLEQFDLKVDGESLTEEETRGIIAYVRSLRQTRN